MQREKEPILKKNTKKQSILACSSKCPAEATSMWYMTGQKTNISPSFNSYIFSQQSFQLKLHLLKTITMMYNTYGVSWTFELIMFSHVQYKNTVDGETHISPYFQSDADTSETCTQIHPTHLYTHRELCNLTASFLYSHSTLLVGIGLSNAPFPRHKNFLAQWHTEKKSVHGE